MGIRDKIQLDLRAMEGMCRRGELIDLSDLFYESAAQAERHLPLPPRVHVAIRPELLGRPHLRGYAFRGNMLVKVEDPRELLRGTESTSVQEQFATAIAHELHHCVRQGSRPPSVTLAQRIVAEGLARRFEVETQRIDPLHPFDSPELRDMRERAVPLLDARPDGEDSYDFGTKTDAPFLRREVYLLGAAVVADYLKDTGTSAAQNATVPARAVMAWWRDRGHRLSADLPRPA